MKIFKKKDKAKSLWDDPMAYDIYYLQLKNDINEMQHTQKTVDNGEYQRTHRDIKEHIKNLERIYELNKQINIEENLF